MTFKEFMKEVGYDPMTTFWEDFSIADKYGIAGVKDTYKRAFSEWKDDYKFFWDKCYICRYRRSYFFQQRSGIGSRGWSVFQERRYINKHAWEPIYI